MEQPWSEGAAKILDHLQVSKEKGLTEKEVKKRRKKYGRNKLKE
ncbi:MAG: cation-transporting P-type ATPase, partial [Candidatus Aenigmatarchaeota archaeon]